MQNNRFAKLELDVENFIDSFCARLNTGSGLQSSCHYLSEPASLNKIPYQHCY